MTVESILQSMLGAAAGAFGDEWKHVKNIVPTEFQKFAVQLAAIPANVAKHVQDPMQGYSAETGKILAGMQVRALEATLTAVPAGTLITVHRALNAIFDLLKQGFLHLGPFL